MSTPKSWLGEAERIRREFIDPIERPGKEKADAKDNRQPDSEFDAVAFVDDSDEFEGRD